MSSPSTTVFSGLNIPSSAMTTHVTLGGVPSPPWLQPSSYTLPWYCPIKHAEQKRVLNIQSDQLLVEEAYVTPYLGFGFLLMQPVHKGFCCHHIILLTHFKLPKPERFLLAYKGLNFLPDHRIIIYCHLIHFFYWLILNLMKWHMGWHT